MASFVQIAAVALLVVWCFQIIAPFLSIVLWGLIIAVALYPVHIGLTSKLGGREKLSSTIFVLLGLAILLVPTFVLTDSSISALKTVGASLKEGSVTIAPPDASVAEWPLIGERVHQIWADAAANLESTLNQYEDQLRALGGSVARAAGSLAVGVLQFVFSIIIAGVFLVSAEAGYRTTVGFRVGAFVLGGQEVRAIARMAPKTE